MAQRAAQESEPLLDLPAGRLPRHVGVIMDGNGRWANERGMVRTDGHSEGANAVREVVRAGRRVGLQALTLFAFSSQNWDRPPQEVFHLMQLLRRYLIEERAEILDNGIRLQTVGDTQRLPLMVREPLDELMEVSAKNEGMILCLALSYGGRETITRAVRDLCQDVADGRVDPDSVDVDTFESYLPSSRALPPLDLLIRTSGERRISNFFLWEVAYAELYFTEKMWPEFGKEDLLEALRDYAGRERRFGLTGAQVDEPAQEEVASNEAVSSERPPQGPEAETAATKDESLAPVPRAGSDS
jgi:undecaprenyl diphosphate synthase